MDGSTNQLPTVADDVDVTDLAVIEQPALPALPDDGTATYFKPAGEFYVDLDTMHVTVGIIEEDLAERAKKLFDEDEAMCFIVVVGEDGYEYRAIKAYHEGFISIRVPRPGTYYVLGLVMTPEQAHFTSRNLFKRSLEDVARYAHPIVEQKDDGTPKLLGYAPLNWAIQTGVEKVEVTTKHVRVLSDTWYNRWTQSSVFYDGPPTTDLAYAVRLIFAFTLQPILWFVWMFGKGALVSIGGLWHAVFYGARDYDWGALFDPDMGRSRRAGWECVSYSRADFTQYGEPNVQAPFARALVPAQWWKGILLGVAVANLFFAGTPVQMLIWSAVSTVGLAWLQFRIADNDGQFTPAWRYLLNGGGSTLRSLRISKLPYVGKFHNQINRWLSAQRARIFRPIVAPKTVGEQ